MDVLKAPRRRVAVIARKSKRPRLLIPKSHDVLALTHTACFSMQQPL